MLAIQVVLVGLVYWYRSCGALYSTCFPITYKSPAKSEPVSEFVFAFAFALYL